MFNKTALAVSALAEMSSDFLNTKNDLLFKMRYDQSQITMVINNTNSEEVQQQKLDMKPDIFQRVHLDAEGTGIGFVAITCDFVHQVDNTQTHFFLSVGSKLDKNEKIISLKICTNFIPKELRKSYGMAIVEANLPSGFRFQDGDEIYKSLMQDAVRVRVRTFS